jgi:Gram-negative bacterial TonB protein C-terminal
MQIREQRFLVSREPLCRGFWTSFVVLLTARLPKISMMSPIYLFRGVGDRQFRLHTKALLGSIVMHGVAIFLLVRFIQIYGTAPPSVDLTSVMDDTYYPLPSLPHPDALPKITPKGPGGKPGRSQQPQEDPMPGSSSLRKDLTVISTTSRPDNMRQTIIQPKSPPDLIIKQDLKLPNLVLGNPLPTIAKPQVQFPSSLVKPITATHANNDPPMPQPLVTQQTPQLTIIAATVPVPRLALPLPAASGSKPTLGGSGASSSAAAALEAPAIGGSESSGPANGVLILGTDPAAAGTPVILPPGNRYGSFSISAAGGEPGSPGGVSGGVSGGGPAGVGDAGDESSGVGSEKTGGGGGGPAIGASGISVTGPGAIAGGNGNLVGSIPADAIYPVIHPPHIQRNTLSISAGGVGGGGLGVYQALPCSRIYTIFVPMPTSTWTLQYCQQSAAPAAAQPQSNTSVSVRSFQTQESLLPPDPLQEFDFRRTPLAADLTNKMLILKGVIREDGTVDKLEVYRSVMKQVDDIALAAMSKWKFSPAKRGEKPVAVQILVGIQLSAAIAAH